MTEITIGGETTVITNSTDNVTIIVGDSGVTTEPEND